MSINSIIFPFSTKKSYSNSSLPPVGRAREGGQTSPPSSFPHQGGRNHVLNLNKLIILTLFVFLLFPFSSSANDQLEKKIEGIIASSVFIPQSTGIVATSLKTGETLVSINGDSLLNPASCTKIITAAAALEALGPDYRFETRFFTNKKPNSAGEVDTLYIYSNGDPSLISEKLWRMTLTLSNLGLKSIKGDIVVDDSFFDGYEYPNKKIATNKAYNALTSAFSVNFNTVMVMVSPGNGAGSPANVTIEPSTGYTNLVNNVKTGNKFAINIGKKSNPNGGETLIVSGSIPLSSESKVFYQKIDNPVLYATALLTELMAQNKISFNGTVRKGTIPSAAYEILREKSKPLAEIVRDMMKHSSNFTAEQITKHLGAVRLGRPGSTEKGINVISDYLESIGIPKNTYSLENGSGLSSSNRLSAKQLTQVLTAAYNDFRIRPDFIASLSILGVDGTMRKWNHAPQLRGALRAKTGSLANVSTLAGYIPAKSGDIIAFAILANGFKKGKYSLHETQLKIASEIANSF